MCHWDVTCSSALWWLTAALFQTRNEGQACFQRASIRVGYRYVWVILLYMTYAEGAEALNLAVPCSTFLATCLRQRQNTSALRNLQRTRNKRDPNADPQRRPEPVCVSHCLVCTCLCYTICTDNPKTTVFGSPSAITIETEFLFMRFYRRMSADFRNNISLSLTVWQKQTFLMLYSAEFSL